MLDSVLAQDLSGIEWEVIVADGVSDDGTRDVLARYHRDEPRIRVIDNPDRAVPAGLNRAIRESRGEVILRMDAHTDYAPDYVRRCLEALDATSAENVGGPARTRPRGYWGRAIAAAYHSPVSCGGAKFHDPDYEGWVDTVPYGCWRKATLNGLGLFDEKLVRNQDDEFNLRILRAGGKIWQSPRIVSWYQPRASLRNLSTQYFQYGFWKVAVIRKHRIPASWRHLVPAGFVGLIMAAPLVAVALAIAGIQAAAGLVMTGWVAMLASYIATCVIASLDCAHKSGWRLLPALPPVFFAYHFSYGLGFLAGLLYWPALARSSESPGAAFTKVSR